MFLPVENEVIFEAAMWFALRVFVVHLVLQVVYGCDCRVVVQGSCRHAFCVFRE
jgi:hypothetical protein